MSLDVNISEPDEFNCIELHDCIKEIAKIKDFVNFVYHVDYICGNSENFIANIFRVHVKDSANDNNQVNVIIKTLINTEKQYLFHDLHKREVDAYKVLAKFNEIQENVDMEERIVFPELILAKTEKLKEFIVLEDMKDKGFEMDEMTTKHEKLDLDKVCTIIKQLAKFHSITFMYEKCYLESFAEIKKEFHDVMFSESFTNKCKIMSYFRESFATSLSLVENFDVKQKLLGIEPKLLKLLQLYTEPGKSNVLCHGDCWINNILFKKSENKTQICFIDFQTMRYTSPLTDIYQFLYLCTESTFRTAHFEDITNLYYDTLVSSLNNYDINVNIAYKREDFDEDVKEYMSYGLLIALIDLRLVADVSYDEKMAEINVLGEAVDKEERLGSNVYYKYLVNDLVNECNSNGVLDKLIEKANSIDEDL